MNEVELARLLRFFYRLGAKHNMIEDEGDRLPSMSFDHNEVGYPSQWDLTYKLKSDDEHVWISIAKNYVR